MTKQKDFSQTQVRMPTAIYEELKESADRNFRSLNAEILHLLQIGMKKAEPHATPLEIRHLHGRYCVTDQW
jgi:hypothetical protein